MHVEGVGMAAIAIVQKMTAQGKECFFGFRLTSVRSKKHGADPDYLILKHQQASARFINLLYDPEREVTYALRYIIEPNQQNYSMGDIQVALLVKILLDRSKTDVRGEVTQLATVLKPLLGSSFNEYSWKQIDAIDELQQFLNPIQWTNGNFAEIRRREDSIPLGTLVPQRSVGFMQPCGPDREEKPKLVNYIHPYVTPKQGFPRVLKALLQGSSKTVLTTLLKPTVFSESEKGTLSEQIEFIEDGMRRDDSMMEIQKIRANILIDGLLRQYLTLQDAPFYLTFTVASESMLDRIILEMIGLGITEPIGQSGAENNHTLHFGGYDVARPQADIEQAILIENMRSLSQRPWPVEGSDQETPRLRYLFDGKEAVSAFYLPLNIEENLPGIATHYMEEQALPREMIEPVKNKKGSILMGRNHFLGFEQDLFVSEATRRQHTYIIGQTGTGKTTLMKTMILSDMKAGNGLAVIDPHGELYDDLLGLIPEERKNDVVLLNPSDTLFPVGFNMLEVKHDDEREAVIKEIRAILKRFVFEYYDIKDGGYAGPVFFTHIQNNLLLASSDTKNPGTILEANNIFLKPDYWERWMPLKWKNHVLQDWVTNQLPKVDYQAVSRDGGMYGDFFSSKLSEFTNDPRVSLIFGQPFSTINFADIIENKKILLVNLSKGLLGEASASMLGMILMAKFNTTFMERRKYLEEGKKLSSFYLYVDEFQNIATENFSILLSEARKFGLGLVLANQFISQVREQNIREAIFGNVGTLISFRLGIDDANIMESQFLPHFNFQDICNLPNYTAIIRTNIEGKRTLPCNFHTILPEYTDKYSDRKEVVNLSRQKYGIPKELAEFLVEISLGPDRLSATEFYFQNKEKAPDEQLLNCDLSLPLSVLSESPEMYRINLERVFFRIKAQIIRYLVYEKSVPTSEVAKLYSRMKDVKNEEFFENPTKFLKLFSNNNPEQYREFVGISNFTIRDTIVPRLHSYAERVGSKEEALVFQDIFDLIEEENWGSCFAKIGGYVGMFSALQDKGGRFVDKFRL